MGEWITAYSLRGDGQPAAKLVDKSTQLKALDALLESVSPGNLMLPPRITELIPPRPAGYEYNRELFKKRTGLIFDNLSPAETAADLPMSFIFHPERLSRLAQQEMAGGLGITEMVNRILAATWKAPRQTGMEKLIQQQTEQIVLTYLLASSVDEQSSFAARSSIQKSLSDLKIYIEGKNKTNTDNIYGGHLALALERMKAPEKAKPTQHAVAPPGAPIGCW